MMRPDVTFVGVPRIELGSHAPKACILPLYYTPTKAASFTTSHTALFH